MSPTTVRQGLFHICAFLELGEAESSACRCRSSLKGQSSFVVINCSIKISIGPNLATQSPQVEVVGAGVTETNFIGTLAVLKFFRYGGLGYRGEDEEPEV